jgi:mitochondrial cardiolipin hydrolase
LRLRRSTAWNVRRIVGGARQQERPEAESEVFFTRQGSVAHRIETLIRQVTASVDCALYRLERPAFARALRQAAERGVRVRVVLDQGKVQEGRSAIAVQEDGRVVCRTSCGRSGNKSKMHHKFAIFDGKIALTGSYNWTQESESGNFENLVVLRAPVLVKAYCKEFEFLWSQSIEDNGLCRTRR